MSTEKTINMVRQWAAGEVLQGLISPAHRSMLREVLEAYDASQSRVAELEQQLKDLVAANIRKGLADYLPGIRNAPGDVQVAQAIGFAKRYPTEYRIWLQDMAGEASNEFLCQLLKDTENTGLAADWLIYLASEPFGTKGVNNAIDD